MTSIFGKKQMCSKPNCKCRQGDLHGPYYWLIKYEKPVNSGQKGSYKWTYLGKSPHKKLIELGYTEQQTKEILACI